MRENKTFLATHLEMSRSYVCIETVKARLAAKFDLSMCLVWETLPAAQKVSLELATL